MFRRLVHGRRSITFSIEVLRISRIPFTFTRHDSHTRSILGILEFDFFLLRNWESGWATGASGFLLAFQFIVYKARFSSLVCLSIAAFRSTSNCQMSRPSVHMRRWTCECSCYLVCGSACKVRKSKLSLSSQYLRINTHAPVVLSHA